MQVKFIDHTRWINAQSDTYIDIISDTLKTGQFLGDNVVEETEKLLAKYSGVKDCILVNSGTEALYLALRCLGAQPGSEVVVPAYSFVATASVVVRAGLKPVFADVHESGMIRRTSTEQHITDETCAVVPVSMFGRHNNYATQPHDPPTIYDNAQGFSSRMAHGLWFLNCVSFDPMKVVPALGSAGAILSNNDEMLSWFLRGLRKNDPYTAIPSQNAQVPAMIAKTLPHTMYLSVHWEETRRNIAQLYKACLPLHYQDLRFGNTNNHKFPIFCEQRDELKQYLADADIETKIHYPYVLPELPMFGSQDPKKWPVAYKMSRTELSLPIHSCMTNDEVFYVCDKVNEFYKSH